MKSIKVNKDGTFNDTVQVHNRYGLQAFYDGVTKEDGAADRGGYFYVENGYEVEITADTKNWDKTLTYGGKNGPASEYTHKIWELKSELFDQYKKGLYDNGKEHFEEKLKEISDKLYSFLEKYKDKIEESQYLEAKQDLERSINGYRARFKQITEELKGGGTVMSPKFENYENVKGGTVSLDDFKGKFVYIDVWATWCKPCLAELPYLKKVEEEYHDKNIEFVSISVDTEKAKERWKKMIEEKEMGGVQLRADKELSSDFIRAYKISGIPRFIFINPEGKIISSDAPRPSSYDLLKKMFDAALTE